MKTSILLVAITGLSMQLFINCESSSHVIKNDRQVSSLEVPQDPTPEPSASPTPAPSPTPASECVDEKELFEQTYHSFFREQNCQICHSPEKIPSIPGFAQEDSASAFDAFSIIGPDRIEGKLRGGHQGYVFSNYKEELISFAEQWFDTECEDDEASTESVSLISGDINPGFHLEENDPFRCGLNHDVVADKREWQTLVWRLDETRKDLAGVQFKIDIIIQNIEFGSGANVFYCPIGYRLKNPRLSTGESDVHIQSIKVRLNGSDQGVATFTGINSVVPKLSSDFALDPYGASTPFENEHFTSSDVWSLEIDQIFNTRL